MQQKINWMLFLIIGISVFLFFSCKKTVEYSVHSKWTFVNETEYFMFFSDGPWGNKCNMNPNDSSSIKVSYKGEKNMNPKNTGLYLKPEIIFYDGILCDTLDINEGPKNINNYSIKVIKNNDFEYRYVFTKAFAANADTCR